MKRLAIWALLVLLVAILGFLAVRWYVISHFDFSTVGKTSQLSPAIVREQVKYLAKAAKSGTLPSRLVDLSSVGEPVKERQLTDLRELREVYEMGYSHPPADISDLNKLKANNSLRRNRMRQIDEDVRNCSLFTLPEDSYLLNCDGWHPANPTEMQSAISGLDAKTERFYLLHGHLLLYAPPAVEGTTKQ